MKVYQLDMKVEIKAQNFDSAQNQAEKIKARVERGGHISTSHLKPEAIKDN